MNKKLKVVFCGTPDFSIPAIEMMIYHPNVQLELIISMPDRPAGRGKKLTPPPVAVFAKENKVPLHQCDNMNQDENLSSILDEMKPDIIVVMAFAQFLSEKILNIPRYGCINIHTSILPKYRGAAPIQYSLLNGDIETGVSIQKMVKKMDAGNLIGYRNCQISPQDNFQSLGTKLKFLAPLALSDVIDNILNDKVDEVIQDEKKVSFAPSIKKDDGHILFQKMDSDEVFNRFRAFSLWPTTYFFINEKRIKIVGLSLSEKDVAPGALSITNNGLAVGCKKGAVEITDLQPEGKKMMGALAYINGLDKETLASLSLD